MRSVTDLNGVVSTVAASDPVIGAKVTTQAVGGKAIPQSFGSGKIVDLDTDQRRVTQLIGVRISIVLSETAWLTGTLRVCNLRDFYTDSVAGGDPSGVFQSVLQDLKWNGDLSSSKYLMTLKAIADQNGGQVSIKLILDNYQVVSDDPDVRLHGRVLGVIGPYTFGEPSQFVTERRMIKTYCSPPSLLGDLTDMFWHAPCKVDSQRQKLILDLGNSVQWQAPGGASQSDWMWGAILPTDEDYMAGRREPVILGIPPGSTPPPTLTNGNPVDTSLAGYETSGRIVEIALSASELSLLSNRRLGLLPPVFVPGPTDNDPPVVTKQVPKSPWPVLAEQHDGKFADVDSWVLRLNPGSPVRSRSTLGNSANHSRASG